MLPILISAIEAPEDRDLISEFFAKYKTLLYSEAWKYLSKQEDVEDIVSETLARIIANVDKFRNMAPVQRVRYAKVIVRNLSYILLKRSAYFTMIPFEDVDVYLPAEEEDQPDVRVEKQLQRAQIRDIWAQIDPEDRLLLEQKYILEWSDQELASRLGIQAQSLRMRLTRAKRSVIKQLREKHIQVGDWL